jgi:hypothetical protein
LLPIDVIAHSIVCVNALCDVHTTMHLSEGIPVLKHHVGGFSEHLMSQCMQGTLRPPMQKKKKKFDQNSSLDCLETERFISSDNWGIKIA